MREKKARERRERRTGRENKKKTRTFFLFLISQKKRDPLSDNRRPDGLQAGVFVERGRSSSCSSRERGKESATGRPPTLLLFFPRALPLRACRGERRRFRFRFRLCICRRSPHRLDILAPHSSVRSHGRVEEGAANHRRRREERELIERREEEKRKKKCRISLCLCCKIVF